MHVSLPFVSTWGLYCDGMGAGQSTYMKLCASGLVSPAALLHRMRSESHEAYILRGLKVATEKVGTGDKWANDRDGVRKLDNDARTAFEDVSDHPEITQYFG